MDTRKISINRAKELKSRIDDYLIARKEIPTGFSKNIQNNYQKNKEILLKHFSASEDDWNDWKWQVRNRISDAKDLKLVLNLSDKQVKDIDRIGKIFRWAVSPYYLALMTGDELDPIRLISIPILSELEENGELDPMAEEFTNPAGAITRRYPDRLIINVSSQCAMYCRHCQRRRNIDSLEHHTSKEEIVESIKYVKDNPEIRDVLLTGGDALMLNNDFLEFILQELRKIPHVEIIRLGTRTPVTVPQRITDDLVAMLKKYHPIFLNSHFNHPQEITPEAKLACEKLANAGVVLGNQAVLLNGINNNKYIMRLLNQELLKIRVRPYYIFHDKHILGTTHFNTSVDDGLEIMEYLRGYTSGLAIPYYIVNAPGGLGKTPIMPQYLISRGKDTIKIRTWEGNVVDYDNKPTKPISEFLK